MKSWKRSTRGPVGIDVGSRSIKAVQLGHSSRGWCVEAAALLPRVAPHEPISESEAARLCGTLNRQGFGGRDAVLAAPDPGVMTDVLELPPRSSDAPLDQIARMEMARTKQFDPGKVEMACWDVPAPVRCGAATHVMAAACPHDDAERLLELFEAAGWRVAALDVEGWALARACASALGPPEELSAAVDIGARGAVFFLFHQGVVVYERPLPDFSLAALFKAIDAQVDFDGELIEHLVIGVGLECTATEDPSAVADLSDIQSVITGHLEKLIEELRVSISYSTHRYPDAVLNSVVLVGGGAAIPGLAGKIGDAIGVDVRAVSPADLVACDESVRRSCTTPALTTALGLAQYGIASES